MANKVPVAITCFFALSFLVGCGSGSSPAPLRTLTIVSPAPPDGTIGASYGGTQGFSFSANGGSPPYVWSWSAAEGSSVPPGLSLSPETGQVPGTPTTAGVYSFAVSVKDSSSPANQVSVSYAISVVDSTPLAITSPNPPDAILGAPYVGSTGYSFTASGGLAPYTWTWVAAAGSSLPPGLTLSNGGVLSGTVATEGSYSFTVTVSDSQLPPAQSSSTYTVNANPATGLTINSGNPPSGKVGIAYGGHHFVLGHEFTGFPLSAAGGTPPYTWNWSAVAGSSLPPGLKISVLFWGGSIRCCVIIPVVDGTPTVSGTYDAVVTVTDSASPPGQTSASYTVDIAP